MDVQLRSGGKVVELVIVSQSYSTHQGKLPENC